MSDDELPTVTILIPAYNEEAIIEHKIETTLDLDYPQEKMKIIVASDCSTDATEKIVEEYADRGVQLIRNQEQRGKIATLSDLGCSVETEVIIITDANAIFEPEALRMLVSRFRDPRVGMVTGNKLLQRTDAAVGEGEGTYQKYETTIRRAESEAISIAFVTGAMTAIRSDLFISVPSHLEFDHVLPLHIVNRGCRVVQEEDARFHESTAASTGEEYKVRVRNALRGFSTIFLMGKYLNVFRHPLFAAHVISRKVLRWLISIPAVLLFISNIGLLHEPFFRVIFFAQVLFYAIALIGYFVDRRGIRQGVLALPFYFCLVNYASIVGLLQAIRGRRMAVWNTGR